MEELALSNARIVSTSGTSDTRTEEKIDDLDLDSQSATQFRSVSARCNFLAQDRSDIQFASKEFSDELLRGHADSD